MYSIILTAIDKAENTLSARCLSFFDNESVVDVEPSKRIMVKEATELTNYNWVSVDDLKMNVIWEDRFLNKRHEQNYWLLRVKEYDGVRKDYDDLYGVRNVTAVRNIHGMLNINN